MEHLAFACAATERSQGGHGDLVNNLARDRTLTAIVTVDHIVNSVPYRLHANSAQGIHGDGVDGQVIRCMRQITLDKRGTDARGRAGVKLLEARQHMVPDFIASVVIMSVGRVFPPGFAAVTKTKSYVSAGNTQKRPENPMLKA